MTLSKQTLDPLEEAQGNIRTAIKSASVNEKPIVVHQLSKLLMDIENCKSFDHIMDLMDKQPHTIHQKVKNCCYTIKRVLNL